MHKAYTQRLDKMSVVGETGTIVGQLYVVLYTSKKGNLLKLKHRIVKSPKFYRARIPVSNAVTAMEVYMLMLFHE